MRKRPSSVDGFIPRDPKRRQAAVAENELQPSFNNRQLENHDSVREANGLEDDTAQGLRQSDVDASLRMLDTDFGDAPSTGDRKSRRKAKKEKNKKSKKRRIIKRVVIIAIILLLALAAFWIYRIITTSNSIFQGNAFGFVQADPLQQDENGRSNFIIFGTSEDDEGGNHPGAYLTDSIMIASINQTNNEVVTYNIPRDLWVEYGTACNAGYEGKINELYNCYSNAGEDEKAGQDALRKIATEITGMDVQYAVHVNYSVIRDSVDAVGGVEVTIESRDPRGILDRNFDWKCNHTCYMVKYKNGPTGTMDGEHALALARARGDVAPTYGLERSNYDREINQQKIASALLAKSLSAGTITDFGKVNNLLSALGDNLRTNIKTSEIRTLMRIAKDAPAKDIRSLVLIDAEPPIIGNSTSSAGASIVAPTLGFNNYSGVHEYLYENIITKAPLDEGESSTAAKSSTTDSSSGAN